PIAQAVSASMHGTGHAVAHAQLKFYARLAFIGLIASVPRNLQRQPGPGSVVSQQVIRAADFEYSIGINTHIPYTDGKYANVTNVINDLHYLGITHLRDSVPDPTIPGGGARDFAPVADAGFKFDLVVLSWYTDINKDLANLDAFVTAHPGAISSIEGP